MQHISFHQWFGPIGDRYAPSAARAAAPLPRHGARPAAKRLASAAPTVEEAVA
jgi:hypothetical protein